jgi:hypothetical protein
MNEKILTDEVLEELGFIRQLSYESEDFKTGKITVHEVNPPYGRAIDKRTNGMTVLQWNNDGYQKNYFREPLEDNVMLLIGKDGGTRTSFHGFVYSKEDVKFILDRTS